jgi:hypothetical protein
VKRPQKKVKGYIEECMLSVIAAFSLGVLSGCLIGTQIFKKEFWGGFAYGRKAGRDQFKMSFAGPIYCGFCKEQFNSPFHDREESDG